MSNSENTGHANEWDERAEPQDAVLDGLMQELQQRTPECPNEAALLQYLDRTLPPQEQARLLAHIQECPQCACVVADLRPVFAPVAQLHDAGLFPLYRRLKAALRAGQPALLQAWQAHCRNCARCRERSKLLALIGIPMDRAETRYAPPTRRFSVPSFAGGMACMLLLALTLRQSPMPDHAGEPSVKPSVSSRSGTREGDFPDLSAQGILTSLLTPTPSRLASTVEVWDSLPAESNLPRQAALANIYLQQVHAPRAPLSHSEALRKSREALQDVRAQAERALQSLERDDAERR